MTPDGGRLLVTAGISGDTTQPISLFGVDRSTG